MHATRQVNAQAGFDVLGEELLAHSGNRPSDLRCGAEHPSTAAVDIYVEVEPLAVLAVRDTYVKQLGKGSPISFQGLGSARFARVCLDVRSIEKVFDDLGLELERLRGLVLDLADGGFGERCLL